MEIELNGTILADVVSEYQGKKKRQLIVLVGEGKTLALKKITVDENHQPFKLTNFETENLLVEMKEWSMNGNSGISYTLRD